MNSEFFIWNAIKRPLLERLALHMKREMKVFWNRSPRPKMCAICGEHIPDWARSVDHIVPKWVCYELGMYGLVYDQRNYRITHEYCNMKRGGDITDLPEPIKRELAKRGLTKQNYND